MSGSIQPNPGRRGIAVVTVGIAVNGGSIFWFPGRAFVVDRDGTKTPMFRPVSAFHEGGGIRAT